MRAPRLLAYLSEGDRQLRCPINHFIQPEHQSALTALSFAQQLAAGLKFIHQSLPSKPSVIHNWINRFSVFVTNDTQVQITSFQYASLHDDANVPIYPPLPFSPYTAPEIIKSGLCSEKVS